MRKVQPILLNIFLDPEGLFIADIAVPVHADLPALFVCFDLEGRALVAHWAIASLADMLLFEDAEGTLTKLTLLFETSLHLELELVEMNLICLSHPAYIINKDYAKLIREQS